MTENDDKACRYHPEELERIDDPDVWVDMDDWPEDAVDWESFKEDVPEGFRYECCDGDANAPPCEIRRHFNWELDPDPAQEV